MPQLPAASWARRFVPTSGALFGATQGYPAVRRLLNITDVDSPASDDTPADMLISSPVLVRLAAVSPVAATVPSLIAAGFALSVDSASDAFGDFASNANSTVAAAVVPLWDSATATLSISFSPFDLTHNQTCMLLCAVAISLADFQRALTQSLTLSFIVTVTDTARPGWPNSPATGTSRPLVMRYNGTAAINNPVTFTDAVTSVKEASPIGTVIAVLTASDADAWQSIMYAIISSTLTPNSGWPMPFALELQPPTIATFYDPSSFGVVETAIRRGANLVVSLDALDFEAGPQIIELIISATDDGCFANSAVPCGPSKTATMKLTVNVTDVADAPVVADFSAPQAGLSTRGGDTVSFSGTNLGLFDAPPSQLSGAVGPFALQGCRVAQRSVSVVCTTAAGGFGAGLNVSLSVSGVAAKAPGVVSFMQPRVYVSPAAATGAPLARLDGAAAGARISLAVDGVPAAQLPALSAFIAGGLRGPSALAPRRPLALNCSLAAAAGGGGGGGGSDAIVRIVPVRYCTGSKLCPTLSLCVKMFGSTEGGSSSPLELEMATRRRTQR